MPWVESREQFACTGCAGTGEHFDKDIEDWAYPSKPCVYCNGSGYEYREVDIWIEDEENGRQGKDHADWGS
jgi:hypothetical protein